MSKGRIIDKWVLNIEGNQVTIPVRMIAGKVTVFTVKYQHGEFEFDHSDPNIDSLKSELTRWLLDIPTFKFETYFYIEFKGASRLAMTYSEVGKADTSLVVRALDIGATADGMGMFRERSKTLNDRKWIPGRPKTGFILGCHYRLILDSSENPAVTLNKLFRALDKFHTEMFGAFSLDVTDEDFVRKIEGLAMVQAEGDLLDGS